MIQQMLTRYQKMEQDRVQIFHTYYEANFP